MQQVHDSGVRDHPINQEAIWPSQLLYTLASKWIMTSEYLDLNSENLGEVIERKRALWTWYLRPVNPGQMHALVKLVAGFGPKIA